ncbi:MAG: type II toxin-antitoxin system VapC family toxin [Nitrososphaerales archaeon]|nr:type II toxin-antitoxin system VapC family toxin [Nitrososphaerales archaeon]
MDYVFDTSAIFWAMEENLIERLDGNYTLDLARYELGNALWKQRILLKKLGDGELERMVRLMSDVLTLMRVLTVEGSEGAVMKVATELGVSFYDAAFVYQAKAVGASLVTEDERLAGKSRHFVPVIRTQSAK